MNTYIINTLYTVVFSQDMYKMDFQKVNPMNVNNNIDSEIEFNVKYIKNTHGHTKTKQISEIYHFEQELSSC